MKHSETHVTDEDHEACEENCFQCQRCGKVVAGCMGCWDDAPEWCDDCWVEAFPGRAKTVTDEEL